MQIEPTILRTTGADLDAKHDAAVIFIDHQGARVRFLDGLDLAAVTAADVNLDEMHTMFRVRDNSLAGGFGRKHPDETALFARLSQVVVRCGKVLIIGPGTAKNQFAQHLERNHPGAMAQHVIGIHTVDHPTDGAVIALARAAFAEANLATLRHSVPVQSAQASSGYQPLTRPPQAIKGRAER
jgi:hypothetical protein